MRQECWETIYVKEGIWPLSVSDRQQPVHDLQLLKRMKKWAQKTTESLTRISRKCAAALDRSNSLTCFRNIVSTQNFKIRNRTRIHKLSKNWNKTGMVWNMRSLEVMKKAIEKKWKRTGVATCCSWVTVRLIAQDQRLEIGRTGADYVSFNMYLTIPEWIIFWGLPLDWAIQCTLNNMINMFVFT